MEEPPEVDTAGTATPLAAAGMERLIPVRFTALQNCFETPCAETVQIEDLQTAIEVANRIYGPAGIQLYLERYDRVDALFMQVMWPTGQQVTFNNIKAELQTIFPAMPIDAFADNTSKSVGMWLHAVSAIYDDNRRLHVWIGDDGGSTSSAPYPHRGRGIHMLPGHTRGSKRATFAHEFGHFMGLAHTFNNADGIDPETRVAWKRSDRWDLVFKPGTSGANPHQYFSSRAAAAAVESQLQLIEVDNDTTENCDIDNPDGGDDIAGQPPGTVRCVIGSGSYTETKLTNSDALKGIAIEYPDGRRGKNIMAYDRADGADTMPAFLSQSQIAQLKKYMRFDVPFDADRQAEILAGFQYTTSNLGGRRPRLGHARAAETAPKLDFDGDGKRDIAFWLSPNTSTGTGEFRVLLSSFNYSVVISQVMILSLGKAGDIPVPADFNGDGRTDLAVYQSGGGLSRNDPANGASYWRYCPTAANAVTTTCAADGIAVQFGGTRDVPIFGHDFDGIAGDELALYRPDAGLFNVRNLAGTLAFNRNLGSAGTGAVPLVGLYGCDDKADLAVYEPSTARFKLLESAGDWSFAITHQFDPQFVPYPTGSDEDRAAPIVMSGFVSRKLCSGNVYKSRRAAALWYPPGGQWNIIWNPNTTTTAIDQCGYGDPGTDQPIGGVDRDGDGRTDLALFRPATSFGGNGTLYSKLSVAGSCTGVSQSKTCTTCGNDMRAWATPDVTGDNKPDIHMLDLNNRGLRRYRSDDEFATWSLLSVANINAQML
jgi:FG-GAP-like repeat/Pregnancy-associated plasma protein-A